MPAGNSTVHSYADIRAGTTDRLPAVLPVEKLQHKALGTQTFFFGRAAGQSAQRYQANRHTQAIRTCMRKLTLHVCGSPLLARSTGKKICLRLTVVDLSPSD